MKRALFIIVIAISAVSLQINALANTFDLISNGNFSSGLSGWTPWWPSGGSVDANGGTLNWARIIGTSNGTAAGAYQTLNADVMSYSSLLFKCDIMPIYQSLAAPGWWNGGLEYPVHLQIDYIDVNDIARNFQYGFYYSGNGNGAVPGMYVPQNTWYTYTLPQNLLTLPGGPKTITNVQLYGNGWDYAGSADNVQLLATTTDVIPEPATMSLLGLGILGLAGIRKKR